MTRVLRHMAAPLAVPALVLWAVLLVDSPAVRFLSVFLLVLLGRLLARFAGWVLRGAAYYVGWRVLGPRLVGRRR